MLALDAEAEDEAEASCAVVDAARERRTARRAVGFILVAFPGGMKVLVGVKRKKRERLYSWRVESVAVRD